ncbi:LysR family transcriptional regulator [Youhaiella tibetensis]|uniref:LysR family transcriptional regulator n=1 Tax=Paradevosia tibetensis TaxID=1447062 RepID=A0A5B9DTC5_9HYPH|nr:LysR family transcriptional regulator [Youhaiella tibetensis]QEE22039.1 LysR family transcriptional regulator [Youhaiella tibetensis]GGF45917.1 LysR family transcriptional regulator [Youhaiella tibetensis]
MTQDLARIRAFVQVFDAGGFSSAARQHGRSKALLSKYVTDLEDYLGVRLMNRTTRKLSLTEAGEAYYREASQLLQQLDDLDASISEQTSEPRGLLRVSAPRNFGESTLAPAIFAFLVDHPAVTLDLRLEDRYVDLVDEGIDVALRISTMTDSSLIARKIADMKVMVVASPALVRKVGVPRNPDELRSLPCIVDINLQGQANWRFVEDGRTVSVHVNGPVRCNSPLVARQAAVAGLGFAMLPSYLAEPVIEEGKLEAVLADRVPTGQTLQAVYPHRRHLAGKVRALIDHLVKWFEIHPVH